MSAVDLVPWHLLRLGAGALENARSATDRIAVEVRDRERLTGLLRPARPGADGPPVDDATEDPELRAGAARLLTLDRQACLDLLATRRIGRLAFLYRRGVPLIVPVNYELDDDAVLIRTGPGPKMQAAERRDMVSFEVDDIDERGHRGWSVVVTGKLGRVRGPETSRRRQPQPWAPGPRAHLLRLPLSRVEGRWLTGS